MGSPSKNAMKHARPTPLIHLRSTLRALTLVALTWSAHAWADAYEDITQLQRNGQLSEALARADQHLSDKPRDAQMQFLKGVLQRDLGDKAAAIATFTQLTQAYPELAEPFNNLAALYAGQGELNKARSALEMALRNNPGYAVAHENLGDVYAMLASQSYSEALRLEPANPSAPGKLALTRQLLDSKRSK